MRLLLIATAILLWSFSAHAAPQWWEDLDRNEKSMYSGAALLAGIATYSIVERDAGEHDAHSQSEDWFELRTENGGADKLGHIWSALTISQAIAEMHRSWGYGQYEAARRGAWGSFAALTLLEVGDAFTDKGFSPEDFAVNTLGSLAGYWLYLNPDINRKLDFRAEHSLKNVDGDIFTDFENLRFFTAIKLSGFDGVRSPWLKPLEFHIGYYTRGFDGDRSNRQRYLYTGISFNFSYIADQLGFRNLARGLSFVHPPHTTLRYDHGFDD